jgi:protein-disulfide isomerase
MATTAARRVNWFAIWVSVAVVVVLVVVAGVVWFVNNQASSAGPAPESAAVDVETGAIAVGSGEDTVDTYIDFMCPICNTFEQTYGPTLEELSDDGTITLNIHPISILDRLSQGTEFSTRAANAAYCVAVDAPDAVLPFVQAMYADQPAENSSGLDDATLTAIAQQAGASDAVAGCISDGTYARYVTAMTRETPIQEGAGGVSTPTIVVNGEILTNQTDLTGSPDDITSRLG